MRYFLDTEFDGHGGPLLSLALVREDGVSLYLTTKEQAEDPWVISNVLPLMANHHADAHYEVDVNAVGGMIRAFLGDQDFTIISDSPVDIGRFCQAISTGGDGQWQSADYQRMAFEVINVDCYPTELEAAQQHNAWWDAMALRHKIMDL